MAAALELAKRLDLGLAMVCVEETPRFPASIDEVTEALTDAAGVFDKIVASAKALAQAQGVAFESHIVVGHPVSSIAEFIQQRRLRSARRRLHGPLGAVQSNHRQHDGSAGRACALQGAGCEMSAILFRTPSDGAESERHDGE